MTRFDNARVLPKLCHCYKLPIHTANLPLNLHASLWTAVVSVGPALVMGPRSAFQCRSVFVLLLCTYWRGALMFRYFGKNYTPKIPSKIQSAANADEVLRELTGYHRVRCGKTIAGH